MKYNSINIMHNQSNFLKFYAVFDPRHPPHFQVVRRVYERGLLLGFLSQQPSAIKLKLKQIFFFCEYKRKLTSNLFITH